MKKIIYAIIFVLLFSSVPIVANANTNIDYNSMVEYDGFSKAVYESYVTNTTYVAGKYTNNLDYVNQIITQVKDNANALWQGFKNEDCGEGCNWGLEFIKQLLAGGATAIDFIKDFFHSQEDTFSNTNDDWYNRYITWSSVLSITTKQGYELVVIDNLGVERIVLHGQILTANSNFDKAYASIGTTSLAVKNNVTFDESWGIAINEQNRYSVTAFYQALGKLGVTFTIRSTSPDYPLESVTSENYSTINNYIQNNTSLVNPNYKPQVKAELVCPSITTNLQIVGSDLKVNDEILNVNKTTGQTVYNLEDCIVNFNAVMPQVTEDNKIVVSNDDGTVTDVETNEKIDSNGNVIENDIPDCDGVLCWFSNIFAVVKDLIKAIIGIPVAILSGLVDTIKFLFVPSADSFNGFIDELNTTMSEKFNITAFTTVFNEMTPNTNARSVGPATSNVFDGVTVSGLMGTGEVKIIDGTTINAMLPTIHSWIKGFFYVLLAFFNINHFYKLIRGTTIFESMRGKSD